MYPAKTMLLVVFTCCLSCALIERHFIQVFHCDDFLRLLIRIKATIGHTLWQNIVVIMLRSISALSFSFFAVAVASSGVGQTIPAINVKYDFPSSSTALSAQGKLDLLHRDSMFTKRVQHVHMKTKQLSRVLQEFANTAHDQLEAALLLVHPTTDKVDSPYFLQLAEQKQRVEGVSMSDVEELARDAESLSEIYASAAQGRPTAQDEQRSILTGNVEVLGAINAELIHEKHLMEAASGVVHCASCERDHDQLCPEGWSEEAGGRCSGPEAYDGPCMAYGDFADLSTSHKIQYEHTCLVCWPCRLPA